MKAVLFDLGGTLDLVYHNHFNDLLKLGHQALRHYLSGAGLDIPLKKIVEVSNGIYEAYFSFSSKSFIELDSSILYSAILFQLDIEDYSNEELIKGAMTSFQDTIVNGYHIYGDVKSVLSELKDYELKFGLVSNNNCTYQFVRRLQKFDLEKYFDATVVSSELGVRKPHKNMFLHCLTMLNLYSENSIFIGDRLFDDIEGAQNVGMKSIWVKRKNYFEDVQIKADWTVESISEAGEIIIQLLTEESEV